MTMKELAERGHSISCASCGGHGLVLAMSGEPDECSDCGGSGRNWQYPGGAIARYYSGPLIGRASQEPTQ
jgi:DnaJ-class molecular chaperone